MCSASPRRPGGCCWQSGQLGDTCRSCCWSCKCMPGCSCLRRFKPWDRRQVWHGRSFWPCDPAAGQCLPALQAIRLQEKMWRKAVGLWSFSPACQRETPCTQAVLPALKAVLSPAGGCCRAPRVSLGEAWSPRGPQQAQGAPPTCPGSLPGTARGSQLAGGPVPPVPSGTSHLPIGTSRGREGLGPHLPRAPYLCAEAPGAL